MYIFFLRNDHQQEKQNRLTHIISYHFVNFGTKLLTEFSSKLISAI